MMFDKILGKVKNKAGNVKEKAEYKAEELKDKAEELKDDVEDRSEYWKDRAIDKALIGSAVDCKSSTSTKTITSIEVLPT
jgi:uncharacterized protein YjbJ (UPF0337 family)